MSRFGDSTLVRSIHLACVVNFLFEVRGVVSTLFLRFVRQSLASLDGDSEILELLTFLRLSSQVHEILELIEFLLWGFSERVVFVE